MTVKLLFVCLGNICRSPAAEGIMNHLVTAAELNDHIICDSAGTSGYHIDEPPDRRMTAAAKQRGILLPGRSRRFESTDFEMFDLILAMDQDNYRTLLSRDPTSRYHPKVRLMCDYCQQFPDREVPDPYYGGPEGFNHVVDLLLDACSGLLQEVTQNQLGVRSHQP
jgi:protein-tyrosine phosphatase